MADVMHSTHKSENGCGEYKRQKLLVEIPPSRYISLLPEQNRRAVQHHITPAGHHHLSLSYAIEMLLREGGWKKSDEKSERLVLFVCVCWKIRWATGSTQMRPENARGRRPKNSLPPYWAAGQLFGSRFSSRWWINHWPPRKFCPWTAHWIAKKKEKIEKEENFRPMVYITKCRYFFFYFYCLFSERGFFSSLMLHF